MSLYYCMTKDTRARMIYQLVHRNDRWCIFNLFENENKMLDVEAVGVFNTRAKAIDFMVSHYETVYSINGGDNVKFNFPFRFESWLQGETLNSFLCTYFGSAKFRNMKIVYSRDIKLEHCAIQVFQLFIKNKGYDDPLDTVYVVSDEEYDRVMEVLK